MRLASRLWSTIPKEFARPFRPHVARMTADMIQEIRRAVPEYEALLGSQHEPVIIESTEKAILHCIDNLGDPQFRSDEWASYLRHRGRVEFQEGRSANALQTAYRVGGKVAWRHVCAVGQNLGFPSELLFVAAEAIFAYVEELSALAVEGYTEAQRQAAGSRERRRRRLLELILTEPAPSRRVLVEHAEAARWTMPDSVVAVALEPRGDQHTLSPPALDPEVLVDLEGEVPCLVTANPERHLRNLARNLNGWRAAVGLPVPLAEAAMSLRGARRALRLLQRDLLPDHPVTWCADELPTLCLFADEFLIGELARRCLTPLDDLTPKQRRRLADTLLAWLSSRRNALEIAADLDVHPQTVRYRLHQLERLFGDRLTDPDQRLALELALRAERLLHPSP
ncbi:helix-turn-helix domain-containing protein [Crossiella sp. CA198]|uniref:PucR family transcriptional regulator n=1 Tax=Crossiella sp. CA198 TaxID=3455607 RepID=UPI003F8D83B2